MTDKATTTPKESREVVYTPFAGADKIRLTVDIVQKIIAVPTRSGKTCSDKDAMKFIMLCQAQRLNPFAGDAYLIGYDAQAGASFSLITAHQAFLKRAETSPEYEGMTSGVILAGEDNAISEREGDFHLSGENVVGGWAKVFRKGRRETYRRVRLDRFNKGFAQWKDDPAGMIVKCAEADALRSTFPTLLGGLYTEGERIIDIQSAPVSDMPGLTVKADVPNHPAKALVQESSAEATGDPEPEKPKEKTPQQQLSDIVIGAGFGFDNYLVWGKETGNLTDAELDAASFDEIPAPVAIRHARAPKGLLTGLKAGTK